MAIELGLFDVVLDAPQNVEKAAGLGAGDEEIGEGQLCEMLAVDQGVASTEEVGVFQIGEDDIFMPVQIFSHLQEVLLWPQVVAAQFGLVVAAEERLKFNRDGAIRFREQEIDEAVPDVDLRQDANVQDVPGQRAEQMF